MVLFEVSKISRNKGNSMMRLKIDINDSVDILNVYVVRTKPTNRQPEVGELCDYDLYEQVKGRMVDERLTEFQFPYGDGVQLGIEILEVYQSVQEFLKEENDIS